MIGLAVGATAGLGLIAFIIYREISRRKSQKLVLEARPAPRLFDGADGAALLRETQDAQGGLARLGSARLCLALTPTPACQKHVCVCERLLVPTALYVLPDVLFHEI